MNQSEIAQVKEAVRGEIQETLSHMISGVFRDEVRAAVREEVKLQLDPVREVIGRVNDTGTGGTGLSGQLARTVTKVDTLFVYRNIGTGLVLAFTMTSALLYLGLKTWLQHQFGISPTKTD